MRIFSLKLFCIINCLSAFAVRHAGASVRAEAVKAIRQQFARDKNTLTFRTSKVKLPDVSGYRVSLRAELPVELLTKHGVKNVWVEIPKDWAEQKGVLEAGWVKHPHDTETVRETIVTVPIDGQNGKVFEIHTTVPGWRVEATDEADDEPTQPPALSVWHANVHEDDASSVVAMSTEPAGSEEFDLMFAGATEIVDELMDIVLFAFKQELAINICAMDTNAVQTLAPARREIATDVEHYLSLEPAEREPFPARSIQQKLETAKLNQAALDEVIAADHEAQQNTALPSDQRLHDLAETLICLGGFCAHNATDELDL